ncbi:hypothetical protein ACI1TZ_10370 [Lactococcus formosensis subsp. formosensis]|uniref:hypothetical protein n=1 Tax=Lactococcus formosensis TaxID=1281486 RepID=UPI003854FA5E
MEREVFDDLWDKADREYRSQGNNSFTFRHHLFAVLDDELKVQPKLSIPKKIAEHDWMKHLIECSNLSQFEFERYDDCLSKDDEQFLEWVKTDKNENILYIYLASKALGVELVEVEG